MHTIEALGAIALGAGFGGAVVAGFVLYFASRGVLPVPNPSPPGDVRNTSERKAFFGRYNAKYVAVTRSAFRVLIIVGVVGLTLLIVGAAGS